MTPDLDKYRKHLSDLNLSEAEEIAILEPLWRIVEGFADCAWGLDPVQNALGTACGQVEENFSKAALTAPFDVEYLNTIIALEFKEAAQSASDDAQQKANHDAASQKSK